ncbi:hypothetical protein PRIPAC_90393 [Pristionchus pacificus]|uniref:Uncharacterized protein n=1 Tax=Pristionchus pacificus TaxID=54126 RepID=A0A2A6CXU4_PRIPA|nr:hypothetical protein PRIPAC_90393 [Pristionchus pacificus]|eukprot:PDM82979.1 hypothetical protein PRIPAC_37372 [Pristionchus pacificus]
MSESPLTSTLADTAETSYFLFYFSVISLLILTVLFIFYICYAVRRKEIERPNTVHIPHPHPACDIEASIATVRHAHCPRAAASRTRSGSATRTSSREGRGSTRDRALAFPMEQRRSSLDEDHTDERTEEEEVWYKSSPSMHGSTPENKLKTAKPRDETPEKSGSSKKEKTSPVCAISFKDEDIVLRNEAKAESSRDKRRGRTPDSSPKNKMPTSKDMKFSVKKKRIAENKSTSRSGNKREAKQSVKTGRQRTASLNTARQDSVNDIAFPVRSKSRSRSQKSALVSPAGSSGSRFTEFTLPPTTVSTQPEYVSERAPFE